VGLIVPLHTTPLASPATYTGMPWRGIARSATVKPTSLRGTPAAFCASSAARPTKSPLASFTVHARFAS
jgi:hypothetical protein